MNEVNRRVKIDNMKKEWVRRAPRKMSTGCEGRRKKMRPLNGALKRKARRKPTV